jgi:hypothetical protein
MTTDASAPSPERSTRLVGTLHDPSFRRRRCVVTSRFLLLIAVPAALGCGNAPPSQAVDAGIDTSRGFGPPPPAFVDGGSLEASWRRTDGGFVVPEAGVVRSDRFVTKVVSYSRGPCSGFGLDQMPQIVFGPPIGGGPDIGSTDVFSLGNGGEIVVSFEPNAIVDGPGVDFIVFENPFYIGGSPDNIYAEPAEVSVSDDGMTWTSFPPCTDATNSGRRRLRSGHDRREARELRAHRRQGHRAVSRQRGTHHERFRSGRHRDRQRRAAVEEIVLLPVLLPVAQRMARSPS